MPEREAGTGAPGVFPDFVREFPAPDGEVALDAYLSVGDHGLVMFYEAPDDDVVVPEHTHGDQWGVVLKGTVRITIGGETHECRRGDTYFVPAGTPHVTWVGAGSRGIDVFAEHDRYLPRAE